MFNKMCIEVAFLAGVCIFDRDTQRMYPLVIIVSIHVTCDCPGPESPCRENRHDPLDQGSLSGSYGSEQIDGTNSVRLETGCIFVCNPVIDVENVFFKSDVDMMHG